MATIKVPSSVPSPIEDCEKLHQAIQDWKKHVGLVIEIVTHRNAEQRELIKKTYYEKYGETLIAKIDALLPSNFQQLVLLWMYDSAERDAFLANEAMRQLTVNCWVILEIACTRSSIDLFKAKQAYHARYKRSFEEDVAYYTTGSIRKLLFSLASAFRYEGDHVFEILSKAEAKQVHERISKKKYDDEDLIRILTTRSRTQLQATLNQYKEQFRRSIFEDLVEDPNDDYVKLLKAAIKCLISPMEYYTETLRLDPNRVGSNESTLTRVIFTQAEVNLKHIKEENDKSGTVTLDQAIRQNTSGIQSEFLLALI